MARAMIDTSDAKNVIEWLIGTVATLLISLFAWMAKSTHDKWRQVILWYQINKEINILSFAQEIVVMKNEQLIIKTEQLKIRDDIKESFQEQKESLLKIQEMHHDNIIFAISHMNENNKQSLDHIFTLMRGKK